MTQLPPSPAPIMTVQYAPRPLRVVKLHATCVRSSKRTGQEACQLVVSDVCGPEGPRLLYILQRWLPLVLAIRSAPAPPRDGGHAAMWDLAGLFVDTIELLYLQRSSVLLMHASAALQSLLLAEVPSGFDACLS